MKDYTPMNINNDILLLEFTDIAYPEKNESHPFKMVIVLDNIDEWHKLVTSN